MEPNQPPDVAPELPELTPEMLQQNPLLVLAISAFGLLMVAFLVGTLASWFFLVVRSRQGKAILPVQPWHPRLWGLADLIVIFVLAVSCQGVFAVAGVKLLDIDIAANQDDHMPLSLSAVVALGNVAAAALGVLWIVARYQVTPAHVGFVAAKFPKQMAIGLISGLATLPLIYVLMSAVSTSFETEYEHPLLEQMKANGSLTSYLLGVLAAVIVAPLVEEFLFRVIIQGWLQSIPFSSLSAILLGANHESRSNPTSALFYHPASRSDPQPAEIVLAQPAAAAPPEATYVVEDEAAQPNPYLTPNLPIANRVAGSEPSEPVVPPIWPAIVTGILFGAAHLGYGLSFVPITLLGIILGLLYRATHSIWPCILVHFMLNASSMLALGMVLLLEHAKA